MTVATKVELEDALSCDDDVLDEVFRYVDPPLKTVVRVPQMFVAKLRYQLGWFLRLVYDYGIPVFYWAHRQFADVVNKRYLLRCGFIARVRFRPKPCEVLRSGAEAIERSSVFGVEKLAWLKI